MDSLLPECSQFLVASQWHYNMITLINISFHFCSFCLFDCCFIVILFAQWAHLEMSTTTDPAYHLTNINISESFQSTLLSSVFTWETSHIILLIPNTVFVSVHWHIKSQVLFVLVTPTCVCSGGKALTWLAKGTADRRLPRYEHRVNKSGGIHACQTLDLFKYV